MSAELQTVHRGSASSPGRRADAHPPITAQLAHFCAELDFAAIPRDVVDKTKLCLLDSVGTMLAAATTSLGLNALRAAARFDTQPIASVLGTQARVSPPVAALVNGTFSEIFELQDGWRFGNDHPCVVIPAALAVAQWKRASGKALLEAVVAGYEVTNRLAFAVHPRHLAAGFLPTGTAGTCGSAAAASRLMGFDARQTADALGVAGFILPISTAENLWCGYTAKPLHSGYAARLGIEAALLSEQGFAGCPIEGTPRRGRGFLEITTGDVRFERIVDRLGEHYTVRDVYFKAYPACRHAHGTAEAALRIVAERALDPREIERVDVHTYTLSASLLDRYTDRDSSMIASQFSIPYVAAAAIVDRSLSTRQFVDERIHDAAILDLSRRVRVHADAAIDSRYPEVTPTRVEIRLRNGEVLRQQVDMPKGDPRTPMTERELIEKFEHLAGLALDRRRVEQVRDEVMRIDEVDDVVPLFGFMTPRETR